ncbi:MAG: carbohydrate binding domain-containing protein [Thermoflexales bacterium]
MRRAVLHLTALSLVVVVTLWLTLVSLQRASALPTADLVVYGDNLASGWSNWSWYTTVNFNNNSPVFGGSKSIAATLNQAWAGLSLRTDTPVLPTQHYTLTLRVHGGTGAPKQLRLAVRESDTGPMMGQYDFTAPTGTWTTITRTFADFGNPIQVARIDIADRISSTQGTFYVDEIRWLANTPSSSGLAMTVTIQASSVLTPFLPDMLGSNLPAWLGPSKFSNPTFRARTAASGLKLLRLPGGSWSNSYGWLSCEMGSNQPGAEPCGWGWESWASRPTHFINFLKATGMRGMWVVNPNGTSKEAAALVAFMNGSVNDNRVIGTDIRGTNWYTVGRWAALRVAGGNPDPVGIKLWEFGNEVYASKSSAASSSSSGLCVSWAWEDTWTCDGYEYVNGVGSGSSRREGYLEFRQAMQFVDPTITLAAVGTDNPGMPSDVGGVTYSGWGSRVISAAGSQLEMYTIHPYPYFNLPPLMSQVLGNPQTYWPSFMGAVRNAFNTYGGERQAPVAITEFNLVGMSSKDMNQWMTRAVNALFLADSLGQAAQQGAVLFAQWDLANGRDSNGTEYGLMHEDNGFFRSPQYYVYPLWSRFGAHMVAVTSTADPASQVSVYAGWVNSSTVSLLAVNKLGTPVTTTIQTPGFGPLIGGTKWQIAASSLSAQNVTYNGVLNPADDLSNAPPTTLTVSGHATTQVLPSYSVTLFHLQQPPPNYPPRAWAPIVRR